jgi:hypothetical protein
MRTRPLAIAMLTAVLVGLVGAPPLPAQQGGGYGGGYGAEAPAIPRRQADAIIRRLDEVNRYCDWFEPRYRIDCIADQYAQIVRGLSADPAYDPLRTALNDGARRLERVVAGNRAAGASTDPARFDARNPTVRASRALRPTATGAVARRAASAVIGETATVLLRAAAAGDQRRAPFQRIAAAIESNKVLLRSA